MDFYAKFVVILVTCLRVSYCRPPNIVFILTDDQDVEIGGMNPITKTKKLIGDAGIVFSNAFVTSPLCCPSRSSILTGKYTHNSGAVNNSVSGNCSSPAWQKTAEPHTFAAELHKNGYRTFFAGKYLNQYGKKAAGGVEHVPVGWDEWHGLVGNSVYYNYVLSVNGKEEQHGSNYEKDYLTKLIMDRALSFIHRHGWDVPFMMMLSTPACHAPFTPAPQYSSTFANLTAPRNGSFNAYSSDRHWLARSVKHPLTDNSVRVIDNAFRNRWRTLLSVDDLVESVVKALDNNKLLDSTYVIFMSDNGFHLGQLSFPYDKRQMYEFDIRVPLMIRGPGITAGQVRQDIILNIDLAPTIVDLAGVMDRSQEVTDGESFKSLLTGNSTTQPSSKWRTHFLVEHDGEVQDVEGCPALKNQSVGYCYPDCVCEDALNNTYMCVRVINSTLNVVYCQFADSESYVEVYDLLKDPYQLKNVRSSADPNLLLELNKRLLQLSVCSGESCHNLDSPHFDPRDFLGAC